MAPPHATATAGAAVLPDVLEPGLVTVFCGSAASATSAALGAYYARPGNRFWPTLFEAGFTGRRLAPEEFRTVTRWRIGLTDLAKHESGADAALSSEAYDADALRRRIEAVRPRFLAFTGKRPAGLFLLRALGAGLTDYGLQAAALGPTRIFVLPSPSGRAVRWWTAAPWRELAALHNAERRKAAGAERRKEDGS
ncbi:MAG: mismatch-specific DNA-glycosylase [Rhodospirillaceae bacterium]